MSKIPKANPRGGRQMYVPGASPEAQNANLRTVVDELRAHTSQLKKDLEAERSNIKELRREKQTEVKSTRDQEQQKASLSLSELRAKLNHEKQRELATLRESLTKQHDQAINRLLKQKQELLARTQSDSQRDREMHYLKVKQQVWVEAKEEVKRTFEMDKGKLLAEIDELRRGKKKLEEELNDAVTGDRQRAIDLRKQWGEHQREMEQLKKDARRDIQRLMEELKSKDYSIAELEKELGYKSGYTKRLQGEKDSLGNLLNLSKMAESWDHRSSSTHESSFGSSSGLQFGMADGADEDEKKFNKKISDLKGMLRKLEERNKQLVEDKADLERKIRNSTEARNTTPLIEKNKRLLRKIKDLEQLKKKLDERNKALSEENQKLRSLKENMRCRLERENQSLRRVLSKERQQTQQEASNSSRTGDDPVADKEEELKKLRVEVQEQFLEIVELKQAALEQDRLPKVQDQNPSLLNVPNFRPRSSSLTPHGYDDDVGVRSRSGSFGTPIPSPLALSDYEDSLDEVSVDEMMDGLATKQLVDAKQMEKLLQQNKELDDRCTKLQWQLQDSKDQSELLEFRILELEEEEENFSSTPTPQSTAENNQRVLSLEGLVLEKESLIQYLQQEVDSQRECAQQMEDTHEQLKSMHNLQKLTNDDSPSLLHQLQLAKMRVADLERTEAHLNTRIHELEDQLAHLQEDIHLGLAERNRERVELEAEISSLQETTEGLQSDQAQVADRLKSAEECRQSWLEEEEKLQKKLKKKELTETSYKKQIEKLKSELSASQEMTSLEGLAPPHASNNTNGNNNSGNMEESQDISLLQQKIKELELVRESLEAKLKDVEELVLNSDFASEETLREKIAELEQSNKLLNRQLKQAHASDVDKNDNVERAAAEARHTEKEFQGRIKELQQLEQNLLDRVAQLETQDNAWKSQVDSLQDRIQDLEGLRLELKGKLEQAEEHIEELQVAEKFARDELSASHGASSILGESLGLMGEFGELGALPEEEYSDYEEDDVQDTAPQSGGESESQDPGLQGNSDGVKEAESDMHSKIAELEKSEVELMEKVQSLEQVNLELTDLCQDLQTQATEFADENETLKEKLLNLEELQLQVAETSKIKVEELQSEIELLKQRIDDGYRDRNESDALQKEQELSEELEVVKEENLELLDRLESEHTKLQEMKSECEILKTQHQDVDDSHVNNTVGSDLSPKELQQDLERCRSEKAQLEEHFQTEIKELKSLLDELKVTKQDLEQQLKSSEDEMVRLEEVSAELHTGLECRIKELEEEKEELQSHLEALEENSHSPGGEVRSEEQKELEEENQILLSRVTDSEEQCQEFKEQVEVLEKRLQDGRSNLTLARKDSMRKSLECDDSARELADLKKRLKELEDVESDFFDQAEILSKMEKEQEDLKKRLEGLHKTEEEIIEQSALLELKNEELEEIEELTKELKIDLEESEQKIAEQSNLLLERNKEVEELRDNTKLLEAAKEDLQEKFNAEVKLLEESKGELLNIKKELSIATEEICQQKEQLEKKEVRYREMEDILNQMEKGEAEKLKVVDNIEQETSVGLLEQRIEELTQQEREYVLKIEGLEERQVAYEGTIAQADIIVSEVQQNLSEQNELLAAKELELQEAIDQLESQKQIVRELSDKLQQLEDTSHELDKKNELLEIGEKELKELKDSLKECEVECQLKEETLHKLRETEVNLTLKVESLELSKQVETEDTVTPVIEAKVMASQESTVEATSSADGVDFPGEKIPDQDLQERIEELEDRQSAFEETLAQAEIVLEETNQKLCEKSEVCDMQEREMVGLRETVVVLQEDNVKLQSHLEAADDELEKKDHSLKESCSEVDNLKEQLQTLTEKMTSSEMTCNQSEEMENFESDNNKAGFEEDFFREKSVESLTKKVSELTVERDELEFKVKALEERQEAFQETLAHADVIMTERESGFLERIDELESSQSNLQERLQAVNASKSLVRTSQSSDEDDDIQEFSVFTPNAKMGDLENFEKRAGEEKSDLEKRIQELQLEVEELRVSEKGLLKMIEEYKILENSLRVSNDEVKEELNLKKDEIKQLEISLEDGGPDNNLQAQLEELKSGVLSHDDTNLKLIEEINTLKDTITDLQDQLLRSPNQQISFDGFVTPKAADVKTGLTKPKIIISEDNSDIEREILFDQDSLQEQVTLLESKLCDVNSQLEKVTAARDSLQLDLQEKEVTVEKLEKANKYLQDDIDICSTQMEELEQQLSQSSKEDSRVTNSSPESESQSQPQSIKELKETVSDLRKKLSAIEQEKVEIQEQNVNLGKGRKDLDNSAHKLKMQELECSVATLQKELDSANSDRVKTTNRLTEIVQFNREIKKDMRDQEESGKILEEENHLMKREKEILNEKLLTFGVCGEDLLKERMKHEGGRVAVVEKETAGKKKMVGYQSAICIDKPSQTGPLTYLPSEFLLTTVLIEEGFEMTLKEFLEALPVAQSPTDPILLKEGKNYFVEFNKLYAGKDPTPRKALLRRLVRNIPRDKVTGIPRKDAASYPPIPGEESLQQEMRGSMESSARPLDGASSATKTQMMDQFVAALWELPFEHLEINLDTASYWCPDDYDDDSLATVSECEHEEVHLEESARNSVVYTDAPPLPQATPPAPRKRSGSISSDSLAGDFNSLQLGYRRVIRDDSLELETEDEDDGGTLTPTLSTSSFPWRSETNLSSPGEVHSGLLESSKQGRPDTYSRCSESPSTRLPMSFQKSTPSRTDTYGDEMPLSLPRTAPPNRTARNMDIPDSQFERSTRYDYSDKPDAHLNSHLNGSSSYQPETISHSRPDLNLRSRSELPSSTPWTTDQGSPDAFLRNSDGPSTFTRMSPSEKTSRSLESPPPPLPEVSPPNRACRRMESPPTLPGASPPKRVNGSHESSNTLPGTSPQNQTPGSLESSPTLLGKSPQNRTQGSLEPFNALPGTSQPNRVGSESPPTLPDTSPPTKPETYSGSPDGLPPPLPGTSPPKVLATYPGSPGQTPGDPYSQRNDLNEIHDLPPPLPKTIPPKKPNTPEEFPSSTNQQKHESIASGERFENHNNIPYQNGQIVSAVTVDLASDSSSTDTINDQENVAGIPSGSMGKESNPSWDGRDLSSKSSIVRLPSSFDSGMDTVSSITEQEVEAITAASVFAGPDHAMRLPKTPGLQDVAGSVLAKPATPMWLKQMMDWQTAEKAKEETDIGRMKTSIETMEKQLQEKEDVVKELKQNEDNLKKKLRDFGDLRPLTIQLQTKEIDIQDKERQVALLKSEVKQKEREVNALQSKFEGVTVDQIDTNQTDLIKKTAEVANLKEKLEASQDRLKEMEELLKAKDEEETRIKEEMETKEKQLASKEEELQKTSEKIKNLETMRAHQQTPTDHTDSAKSPDSRAPDSRSGDWKSLDAMSDDTKPDISHHASRSRDPRSHDVSQQELHLASALNVLTRENEELRGRIQRYAAIEARWDEMHQQLSDSRHSNRDRDALERKLQMAEDMLREKTSEELRLAEDNSALEERLKHLENERRKRDGIEEDYRNIKDQFDDMEHKKNEAEISVAPLQAKVSYLLQKCKEREAIIQKMAAELEQFRPDRTEQLLSEVSDLTAIVNLPSEEFNDPLPVSSRSRTTRGSRSRHPHKDQADISKQQRKLDKISKSLNDIRSVDESDDDELGRLGAARGRSTLDLISGSLDGDSELDDGGISLGELMRRTAGSRSRSHLTPTRRVEEDGELDLLRSVLDASPSKLRSTSSKPGRDNRASSRTYRRTPSFETPLRHNSPSHHIPVISREGGLADLSYRGSPTVSEQDLADPLRLLPMSAHAVLASSQQHTASELPHFTSQSGDVNTFIASPVDGIYQMYSSPTQLHSEPSASLSNPSVPADMTRTTNDPSQSFGRPLNNYHGGVTPGGQLMTNTNRVSGQFNGQPENGRNSRQNSSANGVLPVNGASNVTMQGGITEGSHSNRDSQIPVGGMGEVLSPLVNQQISPSIVSGSTVRAPSVISAPVPSENSLARAPSSLGGTNSFPNNSHGIDSRSRGSSNLLETTFPPQGQVPSSHITSMDPAMSNSAQRVGTAAIHHGITTHHGHPVSLVNSTGVQSAPVAQSGNQTTLQTSVMSNALHSENGSQPLSNTTLPSNINNRSSLVNPGMSPSSAHQKSNAQEIYKSMNTIQMQPGVGASGLNPRVASHPRSASANTPQGYIGASVYDGNSTTVTHPGYQAAGIASATFASTTPQHGPVQSLQNHPPQNQPGGLQSSTQPHLPNSTTTLPKTQNNGFLNLASSPTSGGQLMSASSNRTSMPGSSNIPASWLPIQSASPQQPPSLVPTAYSSHYGPLGSNGTASPQPHIATVGLRNGIRGVDEPDRSRMIPHNQKAKTNSHHQLSSHGGLRQPHLTGMPQPPRSLIVSKVIGRHGAVLTWHPPNLDDLGRSNGLEIVGYKIFVNRQQKQLVTNAHLTKALVDGINLRTVQTFGIQTVSSTGQSSAIVETEFEDPGMLSSSWSDSAMTESSVGNGTVTSQGSSVVSEDLQERLFMAVYNYNPVEHSPNHYPTYEVAFNEGDIVTVFGSIRSDGFYQGKVRGRRGLVPSNFIEEISMSGSHGRKKHSNSKTQKNGSGDSHRHREGDRRASKEAARTSTKTSGRTREDQKRHGSASRV
ncbi:uncharacterized protein [Asterias amurensis]|uniref:uncharacterized protein n=1 Tax=Asterias amurensis TaxID=7602 RepID=UPI003AB5F443